MLPDRVSNPGPLTYESGALPIALRGPAALNGHNRICILKKSGTTITSINSNCDRLIIYLLQMNIIE